jgi:WXG100 family type VII secretion target
MYDFLHINYDEMHAIADRFGRQAGEADSIIGNMTSKANTLMQGWTGLAEQEFLSQFNSCQRRMKPVPGSLRKICHILHETANIVAEAEDRARREYIERINRERGQ